MSDLIHTDLCLSDEEKKEAALIEIEKILKSNGTSLANWTSMPQPIPDIINENVLIMDELSYNREELKADHDRDFPKLTDEQRKIYDEITDTVFTKKGGLFLFMGLVEPVKPSCGSFFLLLSDTWVKFA